MAALRYQLAFDAVENMQIGGVVENICVGHPIAREIALGGLRDYDSVHHEAVYPVQ